MKMIARNHGAEAASGSGTATVLAFVAGKGGQGNGIEGTTAERVVGSARKVHPETAFREGPKREPNTGMAPGSGDVVPANTGYDKVEAKKELDASLDGFNARLDAGKKSLPARFNEGFSIELLHGST